MQPECGFVIREDFALLYSRQDNPKRMELRRTNLRKILPNQQVWVLACGRARGYKEVLGKLTFKGSVMILKDEFDSYFEQHQCPLEQLPVKFVKRRSQEFLWGWQWSSFEPFTPMDGKVFLQNKRGTVTWVNFVMGDLVGPPPVCPPRKPLSLPRQPQLAASAASKVEPEGEESEGEPPLLGPMGLLSWVPRDSTHEPKRLRASCEFCRTRITKFRFMCMFCKDYPSWHHERCCSQKPK